MKFSKRLLAFALISTFMLASCNGNNSGNNNNDAIEVSETYSATDKANFANSTFKEIIAKTLDIAPNDLTYGDLTDITGLSIDYYSERISNTDEYKDVWSVVVTKDGYDEAFEKYYAVPANERDGLESPQDYSYYENIEEFNGYEDLKLLTELRDLSFNSDYMIIDLNPMKYITNLEKLESLNIYNYNVPDLELTVNFPELKDLAVGINLRNIPDGEKIEYIEDLTPLQSLTKLESLSLSGNIISDLSPLAPLENLTSLSVIQAALTDITPVEHLKNLTSVTFYYNGISDVTPLTKLPKLEYITLDYNYISDISPFTQLNPDVVKYVSLDMNSIEDTEPLRHLGKDKVNFGYDPFWDYQ